MYNIYFVLTLNIIFFLSVLARSWTLAICCFSTDLCRSNGIWPKRLLSHCLLFTAPYSNTRLQHTHTLYHTHMLHPHTAAAINVYSWLWPLLREGIINVVLMFAVSFFCLLFVQEAQTVSVSSVWISVDHSGLKKVANIHIRSNLTKTGPFADLVWLKK